MKALPRIAIGLLLLTSTAMGASTDSQPTFQNLNLPDLGQPADTAMTPAEEDRLGAQVIGQLRAHNQLVNDPELHEYINNLGQRLGAHTDHHEQKLSFYVMDTNDINAFALPGGYISVFSGLIMATRNESELASVMAHEIAHVTQRHIARQMSESRGDTIANLAATVVTALIGAQAGGGDAATAAIMGGLSRMGMQQISYTRAHEHEADRVAILTLAQAGFDPIAMADFFATLQRKTNLYGQQLPQILLSHPVSTTRIAEAKSRAANYPHVKVHTSPEYPYMKARARVLSSSSTQKASEYFRNQYYSDYGHAADKYGYALALAHMSRYEKAIELMKEGADKYSGILAWQMGLAYALSQSGQLDQAREVLNKARRSFPNNQAAKLAYANVLRNQGQFGKMRDYLLSQDELLANYPEAQRMLANGAGHQNRLGEAYYREARFYAMLNDYPSAINQIRTALQTAKLSSYDSSRLRALRTQMVRACHQAWSKQACKHGVSDEAN